MEYLAKNVYRNYRIYQHYLLDNSLADDSGSVTVDNLMYFVENMIDDEEREALAVFVDEAY